MSQRKVEWGRDEQIYRFWSVWLFLSENGDLLRVLNRGMSRSDLRYNKIPLILC